MLHSVAISGYRPSKLLRASKMETSLAQLQEQVSVAVRGLYGEGFRRFFVGGARGFDMICGEAILQLRTELSDIELVVVAPFKGQELDYPSVDKKRYRELLKSANEVVYISQDFHENAYLERNNYMLLNSSALMCYYDGQRGGTMYTYNRARRLSMRIVNLCSHYIVPTELQGSLKL